MPRVAIIRGELRTPSWAGAIHKSNHQRGQNGLLKVTMRPRRAQRAASIDQ